MNCRRCSTSSRVICPLWVPVLTPYDKLMLDLTYIEKYSFWLDIKLMLLTVKTLFQKENTEGVEAWQTSAQIEDEHGD